MFLGHRGPFGQLFLNIARGAPADLSLVLRGYRYWIKAFILQMLMTLFIFLWSLLLIVPGIRLTR